MSASLMPSPHEFEVNGVRYASTKMDAFRQFHVLRKLGPILSKVGPAFLVSPPLTSQTVTDATGKTETIENVDINATMIRMAPALEALSEMSEDECNYILHKCLSVTQRWVTPPGRWVPIWNDAAKRLQYEDIDMMTMMQITVVVLGDNLGGFTEGGNSNSAAPASPPNVPLNTSGLPMMKIG